LAVYAATRPPALSDTPTTAGSVGVAPDVPIPSYLADRKKKLQQLAAGPSALADRYALVAFYHYLTPDQVTNLLSTVQVTEVFLRAQLPDGSRPDIVPTAVGAAPNDIRAAMLTQATTDRNQVSDLTAMIDMIGGDTADDAALRTRYEAALQIAEAEADQYGKL